MGHRHTLSHLYIESPLFDQLKLQIKKIAHSRIILTVLTFFLRVCDW